MKQPIAKISWVAFLVSIFSIALNPVCESRTYDKPMVIRKKIITSTAQNQNAAIPEPKPDITAFKSDADDERNTETDTAYARNPTPVYDPIDKIDPFAPLFKERPKAQGQTATYAETNHNGTTPLEKIDISQLKLTGIVLAASGNRALVKEASGRGYVIGTGTRIGLHGGRVAQVVADKVIVTEKMKDMTGRLFYQETELKLN